MRINLDILNRDVDYSSIVNPAFELDAAEEEPALPSAWRDEADEDAAPPPLAAIERSAARAAALAANAAAAVAGAPRAGAPVQQREEGRRSIRRPRALDDFE